MISKVPGRRSQSSSDWKCSRNGWRRINHRPLTGGCVTVCVQFTMCRYKQSSLLIKLTYCKVVIISTGAKCVLILIGCLGCFFIDVKIKSRPW